MHPTTMRFIQADALKAREDRYPRRAVAIALGAFGYQLREAVQALCCKIDRSFARFADVPYQDPPTRQQWECLLDSESVTTGIPLIQGYRKQSTRSASPTASGLGRADDP